MKWKIKYYNVTFLKYLSKIQKLYDLKFSCINISNIKPFKKMYQVLIVKLSKYINFKGKSYNSLKTVDVAFSF